MGYSGGSAMRTFRGCILGFSLFVFLSQLGFAEQLNMTQILNDPKLLLEHKADVIAGYQRYADAEQKYPEMKREFAKLGDAVIVKQNTMRAQWGDLARQIGEPERTAQLDALSTLFNDAIVRFNNETYNSNAAAVKEAASNLQNVYGGLYNSVKDKPNLPSGQANALNAALKAVIAASATYVDYWNNKFKAVADGMQIRIMTREAVLKAGNEGARDLIQKVAKKEADCADLRSKRDRILRQWASNPDSIDDAAINDLAQTVNALKTGDAELTVLRKDLAEKQAELQQLLKNFGL
jgi:hypothetical protein